MKFYTLNIAGLKRELPIIKLSDELSIASFVVLGDTEIIEKTAPLLAEKLPDVDFLITAEAKGIPLTYEISKILGLKSYIVARKSIKTYMEDPVEVEVNSITTSNPQKLFLDKIDAEKIKGKKVALIDDVISTGQSLAALENLVNKAGGNIVAKAAILAEGDAKNRKDIIYLEELPLFLNLFKNLLEKIKKCGKINLYKNNNRYFFVFHISLVNEKVCNSLDYSNAVSILE